MADDPRDDTRQGIIGDWCPEYSEAGQRTLLAELDRADPLRALLADEDQAVELVAGVIGRNMVIRKGPPEIASAVLAALREVGGL